MMSAGKQRWWGSEAGLGDETAGALQTSVPSGEIRAVTPRAVVAALVVIAASVLWDEWMPYYVKGSNISRSHFPVAFFFPFLSLAVLNMLLSRLRWGLTRSELFLVLGAGLVAIAVPYDGVTVFLFAMLSGPYYFASPENGWALYLHEHIPTWLVPQNTAQAITWYYEGTPLGEMPALEVWVTPLFWWTCLLGAMAFAVFCTVVMLRKQWMAHERLAYPLVEVGRMLTETEPGGRLPAFFCSPIFWVGFGLVMGIKMWNVASYFSPAFPNIPIEGGSFRAFPDFPIFHERLSFYALGFGYFARLDVLFSVWFFILLTAFEVFAFNRIGYSVGAGDMQWQSEALGWQSTGALLFLAGWSLWMARAHLREVWRKAIRPSVGLDDSGELLSSRMAVFGLIGALVFVGGWLHAAGMAFWVVLVFLPVALLTFLGISRVVVELGLVYVYYPVTPYNAVLQVFGTTLVGPSSVTILAFMRVFNGIEKGFVMPAFAQAAKAVDGVVKPRRIAVVICLALALGFAVSVADTLFIGYRFGAYNMGNYGRPHKITLPAFDQAVSQIRNPSPAGGEGRVMWAGIGAAAMAGLTLVRYRVPWWPLHPIGLAVQGNYGVTKTWLSIFLVWAIKSILMRIGGDALYERGKSFFVGLLAAQALSTAIVFGVDLIWFPGNGHNVHNY